MAPIFQTWSAARIAEAAGGAALGDVEARATGISNDGRRVEPGGLFAALRAARDGHEFIDQARRNGARLFLVDRQGLPTLESGEAAVVVEDTTAALAALGGALWREHGRLQSERVSVGITGSNGKTTTKELTGALLESAYPGQVLVSRGNLNNHIGLPLTLARLERRHRWVVLEMGASQPGDIALLVGIAPVTRAAVTSIAPAHVEGFLNEAGVVREKGAIFAGERPPEVAVAPLERADELVPSHFSGELRTVGDGGGTVAVCAYRPGPPAHVGLRLAAGLAGSAQRLDLDLALPGAHNARNLASAVALAFDLLPAASREALLTEVAATAKGVAGRLAWVECARGFGLLDDTYNANPASLAAALAVLAERRGRRWLILGDMLELGAQSQALHRRAGGLAAEAGCVRVWAVGEWAQDVLAGASAGGVRELEAFADAAACSRAAPPAARAGDVILVKGSRGVGLEVVVEALRAHGNGVAPAAHEGGTD